MEHSSKHIPSFSGRKAKVEPTEQKSRLLCTAFGCTRIGSISKSSGENANFVCWAHDCVEDPMEVQKITTAIRQNEALVDWVDELATTGGIFLEMGDGLRQKEINDMLDAKGLPQLKRIFHAEKGKHGLWETQSLWVQRLRNYVWWVLDGRKKEKRKLALGTKA